jgi:integrase
MVHRQCRAPVSAPTPVGSSLGSSGLLERLVAVVRPEFRSDILTFSATDPMFGGGVCGVDGCTRSARGKGLCAGHHQRWRKEGCGDLGVFSSATDPRWQRQRPNASCRITPCGYGMCRAGLCQLHFQRWARSGHADLEGWLLSPPLVKLPTPGARCAIAHCELWPQAQKLFCHAHAATWRASGRPDIESFCDGFLPITNRADEAIQLCALGPQLKLEIQYALQCRRDEMATKTVPSVVMRLVRFLASATTTSLLERSEETWRAQISQGTKDQDRRALLLFARRKVEDLVDAEGWEGEFPRAVWQLRRLGYDGNQTLDFTAVPQPWLRLLVKRWLRWRLATGLNLETVRRGLRSLTRFAVFCQDIGAQSLADIDRVVVERYLADLQSEWGGRQRHNDHIAQISSFLGAIRQHRWDDSLPPSALIFSDDYPRRNEQVPRALSEQVMAQIERPGNLDCWENSAFRLTTLILVRCGLRVNDALRLPLECIVTDAEGAPYLRYVNHKMKREALVPIDEEVRDLIGEQQVRAGAALCLFPRPTKNPDGRAPISSGTYRQALYRWLERCDMRDAHGQPVHLTPTNGATPWLLGCSTGTCRKKLCVASSTTTRRR